jgi:glycosyltransferase involved in cell wall biosynthesis
MAKLSLIIAAEGVSGSLDMLLASLCAQDDAQFEVIISDAKASPQLASAVQEWQRHAPFTLHYVIPPDWRNTPAASLNRAASEAYGDILVFLDDSGIVRPSFIRAHRQAARQGTCHSAPVRPFSLRQSQAMLRAQAKPWEWTAGGWWRAKWRGLYQSFSIEKGALSLDNNFAVWKQDFRVVGGFDERFRHSLYSVSELILRLSRLGVKHHVHTLEGMTFYPYYPTESCLLEKAALVNECFILLQETRKSKDIVARHMAAAVPLRHTA